MIGGSKSKASTSTSSTVETKNLNLQDTEGVTLLAEGGGSVSFVQTDQNAFDKATKLAEDALAAGLQVFQSNQEILAGTIAAHQGTLQEIAKPSDERLQEVTAQTQKTVLMAVALLVGGVALFFIFGRR